MSILQLGPVIFGDTDKLIRYLQRKGLLSTNKTCPCGSAMQLSERSDVSDGVRFRCPGASPLGMAASFLNPACLSKSG